VLRLRSADALRLHEQTDSRRRVDQGLPRRSLKERALSSHRFGSYTLQAALGAAAPNAAATGWAQIVGTYGVLARADLLPAPPTGPWPGLKLCLLARGDLAEGWYVAHERRRRGVGRALINAAEQ